MSNHVHYLLEPAQPEDLSRIMQRAGEKCQVLSCDKAYVLVEKVPKNKVDKLPELAISYRLQFATREKTK